MSNIIVNKIEKNNTEKRNKKLRISQFKNKSKFKDGVLNLPKSFLKNNQ
jgi:hypothetical protein